MLYGPHLFQDKTVFERRQEMLRKKRKAKHEETCRLNRLKRKRKG